MSALPSSSKKLNFFTRALKRSKNFYREKPSRSFRHRSTGGGIRLTRFPPSRQNHLRHSSTLTPLKLSSFRTCAPGKKAFMRKCQVFQKRRSSSKLFITPFVL